MKFNFYKTKNCPFCGGEGYIKKKDNEIYTCRYCDGSKVIPEHIPDKDGYYGGVWDDGNKEYIYLAKGSTYIECHNKLFNYLVDYSSKIGGVFLSSYIINVINGKPILPKDRAAWNSEQKELINAIYTIG